MESLNSNNLNSEFSSTIEDTIKFMNDQISNLESEMVPYLTAALENAHESIRILKTKVSEMKASAEVLKKLESLGPVNRLQAAALVNLTKRRSFDVPSDVNSSTSSSSIAKEPKVEPIKFENCYEEHITKPLTRTTISESGAIVSEPPAGYESSEEEEEGSDIEESETDIDNDEETPTEGMDANTENEMRELPKQMDASQNSTIICARIKPNNRYNPASFPDDGGDFSDSSIGDPLRTPTPEERRTQSISESENWRSAHSSLEKLPLAEELTPKTNSSQIVKPIVDSQYKAPSPTKVPSPRIQQSNGLPKSNEMTVEKKIAVPSAKDWPTLNPDQPVSYKDYVFDGQSLFSGFVNGNSKSDSSSPPLKTTDPNPGPSNLNIAKPTQVEQKLDEESNDESDEDSEKLHFEGSCNLFLFYNKGKIAERGSCNLKLLESSNTKRLRCLISNEITDEIVANFVISRKFKIVRNKNGGNVLSWCCRDFANTENPNGEERAYICQFITLDQMIAFENIVSKFIR